jgi:hypothetical protein
MVALEEAIGRAAMRDILTSILRQPTRNWDYPAIRDAALAAGVTDDTWRQFETRCVLPPFANGCLSGYVSRE